METKIRDVKGKNCPIDKIHYIRYIAKNNVAITLCNETLNPEEWEYTFNSGVTCPACLLATIKRKKVVRRKKDMSTKFYVGLGIIVAVAALYAVNCLFGTF